MIVLLCRCRLIDNIVCGFVYSLYVYYIGRIFLRDSFVCVCVFFYDLYYILVCFLICNKVWKLF